LININKYIIVVTFLILSIYNHSFKYIRPTELLIPFVLIIIYLKLHTIRKLLIPSIVLLSYLVLVYLINDATLYGAHIMQYWVYAIVFVLLAKIFVSQIDIFKYKNFILKMFFISLFIILTIYTLNFFKFNPTLIFFSSLSDEDLKLLKDGFVDDRIPGVSFSILFLGLLLFYIYKVKLKYHIFLLLISLTIFYFNSSRQVLITFFLMYIFLFIKMRYIRIGLITLVLSYSSLHILAKTLSQMKDNPFAKRFAEMIYFYKSPSYSVRYFDSEQVIEQIMYEKKLLFGLGTGAQINIIRYSKSFDYEKGELIISDYTVEQTFHGGDNSFVIFLLDGGLLLLGFILVLFILAFNKIFKFDKRISYAFLIIIFINGLFSKHLVTNYILPFILGFIYFYSNKKTKEQNLKKI
jgi:hypothetical protein